MKFVYTKKENIPRIERAASTIARPPHDFNVYFKNYVHTTQNMMTIQQIDTSYNIINNLVFSSSPSVQHGMKDYIHTAQLEMLMITCCDNYMSIKVNSSMMPEIGIGLGAILFMVEGKYRAKQSGNKNGLI
uniref:Uncharacterized protein n=1 Tax=Glossina austeni TaxID=7395 RepID=A0A1A9UMQ2_GLOAU